MPFYAFTNFDEDNATYTGFRMVEAVELTGLIASLDYETQADLLLYSGQIATALNAGQVEVAKVVVGRIETNGNAQLEALKQAVQAILES